MKAMLFTVMPMFVCMFWALVTACDLMQGQRKRHKIALLTFMMATTLLYFGHCVFFNRVEHIMPLTDTLYCMSNLAVYPLYYIYICMLTHRQEHLWENLLWLLPAIGAGIVVGVLYTVMSPEETRQFIDRYLYGGERLPLQGLAAPMAYVHDVCKALFALLIIPVFVLGRQHIKQFNQLVTKVYADTEDKTLTPLRFMLEAFVITSIASFFFNIIGRQFFVESMWLLAIPSTLFSALLFTIGYIGHRQLFCIEDIESDEQKADESMKTVAAKVTSELSRRIEQVMTEEELFLQPNLKIVDLVQRLATNRNYIYQAINVEMGLSFSEYVNRMRINYAERLITLHPDRPINEIAEQSGFSSNTSFYRNFKHYRGMGPKEFQSKIKKG